MRVDRGKLDLLDDFYEVFAINMRDLGTPVYPKRFFEAILESFSETTSICAVYAGARPVAAGFLIGFNGMLEIPWASSLRDFNRYSPNMILYWTVLKFACDHGYRVFDFGRSTPDEGTYRFKAQWGAVPTPLYWHYWMRQGDQLPELNPDNPKYAMAIWLWKRLPVSLTKWIGPSIVKNLP
jgi:FemAB-related protein (PEP-CTERM system-associated)